MRIQPVVEGHGEIEAVPVLLRRLLCEAQIFDVDVGRPIRKARSELATEEGLARAIALARLQPNCAAILVLFDGEEDCPAHLGPTAQNWAKSAAWDTPCAVCIAHREYESWFLATLDSLQHKVIKPNAQAYPQPEVPRDAKGRMSRWMLGRGYKPTTHQPAFSALFCLPDAYRRSRSFRKLATSFGQLLAAMEKPAAVWPPPSWRTEHA